MPVNFQDIYVLRVCVMFMREHNARGLKLFQTAQRNDPRWVPMKIETLSTSEIKEVAHIKQSQHVTDNYK